MPSQPRPKKSEITVSFFWAWRGTCALRVPRRPGLERRAGRPSGALACLFQELQVISKTPGRPSGSYPRPRGSNSAQCRRATARPGRARPDSARRRPRPPRPAARAAGGIARPVASGAGVVSVPARRSLARRVAQAMRFIRVRSACWRLAGVSAAPRRSRGGAPAAWSLRGPTGA